MKLFYIIIIIATCINAQDSLFWFDMTTVRDPMPKTPKVMDQIFEKSQIKLIDSLKTVRVTTSDGFRLQLYEASLVEHATQKLKNLEKVLSDSLYMVFDAPLYKIRYGNFPTKAEAEKSRKLLANKGLKNVWIVKSRIEQIDTEAK
tara:strand:- start:751 stop:1188 length:438 start_codon:yes stop_codon:yes gene_type:complete